jgi:hypothetical protein
MPEFDGLPQPFKDSYHKNMPLVSSAYWNKFSGDWDHLPPDQKEKALAEMDAAAQKMVTNIKTAAPRGSPPSNGDVGLRRSISDYIVKNSKQVQPNNISFNIKIVNILQGCSIDASNKANFSGTYSVEMDQEGVRGLSSTFNIPITYQQYDALYRSIINEQTQTITVPTCDGNIRGGDSFIADIIAFEIVKRFPPAQKGTSGYAMEGSYLGGLVSTKKDWTLIMILFVLALLLWIIAKKM